MVKIISKIRDLGDLLKISHTLFALPFALSAMLIAAGGLPSLKIFVLILLAMVTARNTGMAFNRYLDADIDAKNPRTASRHIPRGIFSKRFVLGLALLNAGLFVFIASQINAMTLYLSPVALVLLFSYSYMKRFTRWCHLVLGLTLGSSPIAAWVAVRGTLDPEPFLLGVAVLFWVAGFDIIYATQDYEFDQREGLHSFVVSWGVNKSLWLARIFHGLTIVFFFLFGWKLGLSWIYPLTLLILAALLVYEHSLVSEKDLSKVNAAFFNVNGFVSVLYLAGIILSLENITISL